MTEIIALIIGIAVGAALGFVIAWARSHASIARITSELDASRRETDEKLSVLADARKAFEETFKALAGETLQTNSESFMRLARTQMESLMTQADGNLAKRHVEIEKLLTPMGDTLKRYQESLRKMEQERSKDHGDLRSHVISLSQAQHQLREETLKLVNALKLPQVRGQWGEMTLRRTAELAGMAEHCDFTEQVSIESSRQRPDMVVHLPGGREIVIDAKVSLSAYLAAIDASVDDERERLLAEHAKQVRKHMVALAAKDYARQFDTAPDFTVLFLPGEAFFSTAVHFDPNLIADGMKNNVIIATPTTLVALLRAVARGWQEAKVEENAREITAVGRELYERVRILWEHFAKVGHALKTTVDRYNDVTGSLRSRLEPQAKRLKDLSAGDRPALAELPPVDQTPRIPEAETEGPSEEA